MSLKSWYLVMDSSATTRAFNSEVAANRWFARNIYRDFQAHVTSINFLRTLPKLQFAIHVVTNTTLTAYNYAWTLAELACEGQDSSYCKGDSFIRLTRK